MGRSYWFECSKCGYRVIVSGRADHGRDFGVQTVACQDCRKLYDAVICLRVPEEGKQISTPFNAFRPTPAALGSKKPARPPGMQALLNQLPYRGGRRFRWLHYEPGCPLSALHRVTLWNAPDRCPKCGVFMEQSALPFRLWE